MAKRKSSYSRIDYSKVDKTVLERSEDFAKACQETFIQLMGAENGQEPSFKGARQKFTFSNLMPKLIENAINNILWAESEEHIENTKYKSETPNRHNGRMSKTVKSEFGDLHIETPRDRQGTFTPEFLKKREMILADDQAEKIISMYSYGMSQEDISKMLEKSYGISISQSTISKIIDRIMPEIEKWKSRTLSEFYPVVYLDAVYYHVMPEKDSTKKNDASIRAMYNVIGVDSEGHRDLLGFYLGTSEGAGMWTTVLNDLKSRGCEDVGIFCTDGLAGFAAAIKSVYPLACHQRCIVHQMRDSRSKVGATDRAQVMSDLKLIYESETEEGAKEQFKHVKEKWGEKYPELISSWKRNWKELTTFYKFSKEVKLLIYTTNPIEGYHRQIRKFTKTKAILPSDESLIKMTYLIYKRIKESWDKKTVNNWELINNELRLKFGERMSVAR